MAGSIGNVINVVLMEKQGRFEVTNNGMVARALFVFWIAGCLSVLVDLDHVWKYAGLEEPVNFTGWIGRPFHHPVVFVLYAVVCGLFVLAFVSRWDVSVPVWGGDLDEAPDSQADREVVSAGS